MKKTWILLLLGALFLTAGCEKVATKKGNYKEGTYYGTATDTFGGASNLASAVVVVGENGQIASVFLDTTYTKDEKTTTKKALRDEYGMKGTSASIGTIPGGAEWFEQVETLEKKVVAEQGLAWLTWKDPEKSKTDSVSGVTIKIDALYQALENALNKAK